MKILWIVNIVLPEASSLLKGKTELKSTGGWLIGAAESLLTKNNDVELTICSVSKLVNKLTYLKGEGVGYYLLPYGKGNLKYNKEYEKYWKQIQIKVNPDIVHIHGTEYSHGLAFVNACGNKNVVVSIQGMKSAYYYYYYYGLSRFNILRNITFHDIFMGSPLRGKNKFKFQSRYEVDLLRKVNHIIGRTSWDRARTWAINPNAEYHFCNETLRKEFYDGSTWDYGTCRKHSIFVSQAGYPIKGLHQLLKAFPFVLREYPDASIRIAGADITRCNTFKDRLHLTTYGKIIMKLIKKLKLSNNVVFTGNLNANEMKREYLSCNLFLSPSTIENSPNSLGEAQILGVPVISSYVGGCMDFIPSQEYGTLYRFEEVEMLAYKICEVFRKKIEASNSSIILAQNRHNGSENTKRMVEIYNNIIEK